MIRMKQLFFVISISLISLHMMSHAQTPSYQWFAVGGSGGGATNNHDELCGDLFTDDRGNIYGASTIHNSGISIDTVSVGFGFGYDDFCVFSYRCDGSFRWVRFFGSANQDMLGGITVDGQGNVYVTGSVSLSNTFDSHFGDTTIAASNNYHKADFLAKLDSTGHTEWVSLPGAANTAAHLGMVYFSEVELDNQSNPVVYGHFPKVGIYGSDTIHAYGTHKLSFNKSTGVMTDTYPIQIRSKNSSFTNCIIDEDNNTYIVHNLHNLDTMIIGNDSLYYDNTPFYSCSFIAKVNPLGDLLWYQKVDGAFLNPSNPTKVVYGRPFIKGNYLYTAGSTGSYSYSSFFGDSIVNPFAYINENMTNLIARFDKNTGNYKSCINLKNMYSILGFSITSYQDKIYAAGSGGRIIELNQNDTIKPYNTGYDAYPFIVEVDTALTHFSWGTATRGKSQG